MSEPFQIVPPSHISPEEMFGAQSLAAEAPSSTFTGIVVDLDPIYQVGLVAIAFIYIVFLMRYVEFVGHFITSSLGFKISSLNHAHINPSERRSIETIMIALGVPVIAGCAVRALALWSPTTLAGLDLDNLAWGGTGFVVLMLTLVTAAQLLALPLIGHVSGASALCRGLLQTKVMHLAMGCLLTLPFGLLFLLADERFAEIGLWSVVVMAIFSLVLFVKESFLFFMSQKISILHWFLYLCALEIFPVTLILAPLCRGGGGIG